VVELCAGNVSLPITLGHRVVLPSDTIHESRERLVEELKVGDRVLCSDGNAIELSSVAETLLSENIEVIDVAFKPDMAVAVFMPPLTILTKGRKHKRVRRGGMQKRGQPAVRLDGCELTSIPDTEPGLYED